MPKPIASAPKDGRKITVYWTDRDGQENESIAQYRSAERLKSMGDTDEQAWSDGPMLLHCRCANILI